MLSGIFAGSFHHWLSNALQPKIIMILASIIIIFTIIIIITMIIIITIIITITNIMIITIIIIIIIIITWPWPAFGRQGLVGLSFEYS